MSWARIDDGFDDHPKVLALLEYEQGAAAIGLWTLCLTWAHRNTRKRGKVPGLLPLSLPRRYLGPGARELAELLVTEKLWEDRGDEGWMIHDFDRYLPTAETREARADAGRRGAEARWGKRAGRVSNLPSGDGKPITADSTRAADDAHQPADGTSTTSHPLMDGNQPSGNGNLLSGLLSDDGNAMASDGSRAPARRAISKEIAPVPAPGGSGGASTERAAPKRQRGTRIPDDFKVTPDMVAWARTRCPHVDGRIETEKFINHWSNKPGREALKLDWTKAWQNWMLTAEQQAPRPRAAPAAGNPPPDHTREWERTRS